MIKLVPQAQRHHVACSRSQPVSDRAWTKPNSVAQQNPNLPIAFLCSEDFTGCQLQENQICFFLQPGCLCSTFSDLRGPESFTLLDSFRHSRAPPLLLSTRTLFTSLPSINKSAWNPLFIYSTWYFWAPIIDRTLSEGKHEMKPGQ